MLFSEHTVGDEEIYFYHSDHLGSASWITAKNGKPIQYIHYLPYGEILANQRISSYDERYKFTTKELDAESGYYYFGARYLMSELGDFLSPDPLLDQYPKLQPYLYCNGNPIRYVDPDGRWFETAWDLFNLGLDFHSLHTNIQNGNVGDAMVDAAGLVLDAGAVLLPVVPGGAGTAIKAYRAADNVSDVGKAANKFRQAVARGIQSEKRVLKDMGLTKNTSKVASVTKDGKVINVIPDAVKDGVMYEIKDAKVVSNTKQIQGEYNAAKKAGYDFKIVTGEKTQVSSNIPSDVEIIRRSDLGPQ